MEQELLTLPEVAAILRRSPAQLRWMRQHGQGPKSALLANRIFYRRADVDRWIDDQFAEAS